MPYLHLLVSPDCLYQNVPRCGDALGMFGGLDPIDPRYLLHFNGITLEPLGVTNPFRILPVFHGSRYQEIMDRRIPTVAQQRLSRSQELPKTRVKIVRKGKLGEVVVSNICYVHPEPWGNDPI